MTTDCLRKILIAKVYDVVAETELKFAPNLSVRTGNRVYFKCESDQPVLSFKLHSAYNKTASLMSAEHRHGVITASVGNHMRGVTFSVACMECKAVVYMPVTTPQLRIDDAHSRGGDWVGVMLHGGSYSDVYNHAAKLQERHGYTLTHPFDNPEMITGQGTIVVEISRQHPQPVHAIFCSIGGGRLISGIAAYVRAVRPDVKIIDAQSVGSDTMACSVATGKHVELKEAGLSTDSTVVKLVGKETFRLMRELVDEIITVDTDVICAAPKDVFRDTRNLLESSGALALVDPKQYAETYKLKNESLVAVVSGANMNFDRLRSMAERIEAGEAREAVLVVTISEEHGSFKHFCGLVDWLRDVTESNYRIASKDVAHTLVSVRITSRAEGGKIAENSHGHGSPTLDLSNDELAKQHIRYMVSGRSPLAGNEHLYRFEFPEWLGALMKFPSSMNPNWNISLFHYRNQGVDPSNILVGIQVPKNEKRESKALLVTLGYTYQDESESPVCSLFL